MHDPRETGHPADAGDDAGLASLLRLVELSLAREVAGSPTDPGAGLEQRLAIAAIRRRLAPALDGVAPPSGVVCVIGCTNSGKSTLVNLLAGTVVAGMSVKASFTRSLLCVCPPSQAGETRSWLRDTFDGFAVELDDHPTDTPVLRPTSAIVLREAPNQQLITIDTPDFSTEAAAGYVQASIDAMMAGDLVLLVVSEESYADERTLRLVRSLRALGAAVAYVTNKDPGDAELLRDIGSTLSSAGARPLAPDARLPRVSGETAEARLGAIPRSARDEVVRACERECARAHAERRSRTIALSRALEERLDTVLAPLRAEADLAAQWERRCERAGDEILAGYRHHLLDARVYDEFSHAMAHLSRMLEVPVLGPALRLTGQAVRLPGRLVIRAARAVGGQPAASRPRGEEGLRAVVDDAVDRLREFASVHAQRQPGEAVSCLADSLARATLSAELAQRISQGLIARQESIDREVEAIAASLYLDLRERPGVLNALRAANATLGLGSAALVVASHGVNWADMALAPLAAGLQQELLRRGLGAVVERRKRQAMEAHARRVEEVVRSEFVPHARGLLARCATPADFEGARTSLQRHSASLASPAGEAR